MEDLKKLLSLVEEKAPTKYRCFILLAITAGLRRSELIGLEWNDIDFQTNVISVNRVTNYTSVTGGYTDTPKTKKSKRSIIVPPQVIEQLKILRKENHCSRLFVQRNGSPMNSNTPYNWLKMFCKKRYSISRSA